MREKRRELCKALHMESAQSPQQGGRWKGGGVHEAVWVSQCVLEVGHVACLVSTTPSLALVHQATAKTHTAPGARRAPHSTGSHPAGRATPELDGKIPNRG